MRKLLIGAAVAVLLYLVGSVTYLVRFQRKFEKERKEAAQAMLDRNKRAYDREITAAERMMQEYANRDAERTREIYAALPKIKE